jgi:hypothetical protein
MAAWASGAASQTDEIQVYDAEITAPGQFNLTWHNNFTPSGRREPDFAGAIVPEHAVNGVPEWAYGVADWLEVGTYLPVYTYTSGGRLLFDGVKLRALFVVPHAHDRAVFYGLNFELSYNKPYWETSRYSGEIRPIIGTHLGRFDLIFNPILDTDFNGFGKLDFAPALRVAWNISARAAVALENYSDFGAVEHFNSSSQQTQTLFAVFDYSGSGNGIEVGIGHGMTRASDSVVLKLMLMHDF